MQDFPAADFWSLSSVLTRFMLFPKLAVMKPHNQELANALVALDRHCQAFGMRMSQKGIDTIRQQSTMSHLGWGWMKSLLEELQRRVYEELQERVCAVIDHDKARFTDPMWPQFLVNEHGHAALFNEFHRAGVCFAFGQNTACVFHLMRAADYGLKKVAQSLGITNTSQGWNAVAEDIRKKMEQRHQLKSDAWRQSEPFYARILTDVQALGKAYRNDTVHDVSVNYNDRETRYMLTVVEEFIRHVLIGP